MPQVLRTFALIGDSFGMIPIWARPWMFVVLSLVSPSLGLAEDENTKCRQGLKTPERLLTGTYVLPEPSVTPLCAEVYGASQMALARSAANVLKAIRGETVKIPENLLESNPFLEKIADDVGSKGLVPVLMRVDADEGHSLLVKIRRPAERNAITDLIDAEEAQSLADRLNPQVDKMPLRVVSGIEFKVLVQKKADIGLANGLYRAVELGQDNLRMLSERFLREDRVVDSVFASSGFVAVARQHGCHYSELKVEGGYVITGEYSFEVTSTPSPALLARFFNKLISALDGARRAELATNELNKLIWNELDEKETIIKRSIRSFLFHSVLGDPEFRKDPRAYIAKWRIKQPHLDAVLRTFVTNATLGKVTQKEEKDFYAFGQVNNGLKFMEKLVADGRFDSFMEVVERADLPPIPENERLTKKFDLPVPLRDIKHNTR